MKNLKPIAYIGIEKCMTASLYIASLTFRERITESNNQSNSFSFCPTKS